MYRVGGGLVRKVEGLVQMHLSKQQILQKAEMHTKDELKVKSVSVEPSKQKEYKSSLLVKTKKCQKIVQEILDGEHQAIGLDCEGLNLGDIRSGRLTLVQISTGDGDVYLFDVLSNPDLMTCNNGLKDLLQNDLLTKVLHSCRSDALQLYLDFGIHLKPIFDTQLAHALIQKQAENYVNQISYNHLCEEHELPVNINKEDMKKVYRRDPKFWKNRPLTKMMIDYAQEDVRSLLTIRENQLNQLSVENKLLVESECTKLVQTLIQKNKEIRMDNGEYCTKQDRDKIIERQADEIEIYEEANINAFKTIENITQQVEKYKREIETKDIIIKNKDKKLDNYKKAILEQNVAIQKRDKKIENLKMESGMRNDYEKLLKEGNAESEIVQC